MKFIKFIETKGHDIIQCDECGRNIMEGSSGTWKCECGWTFST